jgi:4-hydroxybutyrate dehydrogenase
LVHENMYPDKAVLITEMLMSLPYPVFATSSIDALVHAVESYLSPKASPLSEMFSVQAIRMIVGAWKEVVAAGDKESWKNRASDFLRASTYAGIAFGNAGCAAVHALSYPMGGRYHVPHGQSNQLMFAAVMRKYKEKQPIGKLQLLEDILAEILQTTPAEALETLYRLMDDILPLKALRDFGTKTEELAEFARSVMETQQRLMANNYVELSEADVLAIYESAY